MHPRELIVTTKDLVNYKQKKHNKIDIVINEIRSRLPKYLRPTPLKLRFDLEKVDEDGIASYWRIISQNATNQIEEYLNTKLYHLTQITCLKE